MKTIQAVVLAVDLFPYIKFALAVIIVVVAVRVVWWLIKLVIIDLIELYRRIDTSRLDSLERRLHMAMRVYPFAEDIKVAQNLIKEIQNSRLLLPDSKDVGADLLERAVKARDEMLRLAQQLSKNVIDFVAS